MRFKPGVVLDGITPAALYALSVADACHAELTGREAVATSVMRRSNGKSLHSVGYAVDLRVWYTDELEKTREWVRRLRVKLGENYDVVYGDHRHSDHIHIEYDPLVDMDLFKG